MFLALIIGLGVGFVMAIPPGPVGVGAMKLALNKGQKTANIFSLGNALMDFFYCTAAIFAATALLNALETFNLQHPVIMLLIQLMIVVGIIVYGIINVRYKSKPEELSDEPKSRTSKFLQFLTHKGPFFLGVAIALANIPNPSFFPTLVFVTSSILKMGLIESGTAENFLFSVGFGAGNFLWFLVLIKLLVHYKEKFSARSMARLHQFAGFTLIGFGTILGYRIVTITEWSNIFRIVFAF